MIKNNLKIAALIVACTLIGPPILFKLHKTQNIAQNERVRKWRAMRAQLDNDPTLHNDYIEIQGVTVL